MAKKAARTTPPISRPPDSDASTAPARRLPPTSLSRPPTLLKLGVVTPVLNGRLTFRACAASVAAAAAAAPGVRIVHYVRESDRSSDGGVEDLALNARCSYARGPDSGLYDAISAGLDAAAADGCDILAWLNADEQWLPGAAGHAQRIFESAATAGIVFGDYLLLGPDLRPVAARREIPVRRFYLKYGVNYILSCATFFRAGVWTQSPGFDLSYRLLADKKWYLGALGRGVRAVLCAEYLGAYAQTGANASVRGDAALEQARFRAETGADAAPAARVLARAMRVVEKALHGCYFPEAVSAPLFSPDGSPAPFSGRLGPFWRD